MRRILYSLTILAAAILTSAAFAKPVLVVVGMAKEAKIADGPDVITVIGANRPAQLRQLLSHYSANDVRAVVSFGVAGTLHPNLSVGRVIVGTEVVSAGKQTATSAKLAKRIYGFFTKNHLNSDKGPILGSDTTVGVDPKGRGDLYKATGAWAVDNESQIAAEFAAANGLPFGILRVICDKYDLPVPPAALVPLKPNGEPDMDAVNESLREHPGQLFDFISTGLNFESALDTLKDYRRVIDFSHI
jgi:hypothetical protein